ncbi:MAG: hypothetical protein HQ581_22385 [Planctomycetes bacterium]|nr:hypothetical protein [Planctomycetota bacterium]
MGKRTVSPELLDQLPPQDLEAERAVIGCILLKPSIMEPVSKYLEPSDFYADRNQEMFFACAKLDYEGKGIDHVTLVDRLKRDGHYEEHQTREHIAVAASTVAVWLHWPHYARIVWEMRCRRLAIHLASDLLRTAYDDSVDAEQWNQTLRERGQAMREWLDKRKARR